MDMAIAYLLLGSNLGNKEDNLKNAVKLLKKFGKVRKHSAIYETEPWGFSDERNFFNAAICLETSLNPFELLTEILKIEISIGRKRQIKQWVAREIDIDIIFFDNLILSEEFLTIPHPHLKNRKFALAPLNEIAPSFIHPVLGKSITELLKECLDDCEVEILHSPSFDCITPN
jgi:2-amino-4-hydroxy-6-hydroxymethyldihydropteridine diphosphokinase